MKKCILFIILFAATIHPASANMRAPYGRQYRGPEEVRSSIPNLTVMREDLVFDCDYPYRGDVGEVAIQNRDVRTSATYIISAERETDANFDFISTVARSAEASINGAAAITTDPLAIYKDKNPRMGGFDFDNSRYKISFSGHLKRGLSTINIHYSQPMSVYESDYGYFTISKFRSFFRYDLSPLREWNIDKSFSMNIRITFKDDTRLKHLRGSDYIVNFNRITESKIERKNSNDEIYYHVTYLREKIIDIPIKTKASNNIIEFNHVFHDDFPDMIEASCEY